MTKVTALVTFHGSNFGNVYVAGQQYDFEDAVAQALASQGHVKIDTEYKVVAKEAPKTDNKDVKKTEEVAPLFADDAKTEASAEASADAPKKVTRPKKTAE